MRRALTAQGLAGIAGWVEQASTLVAPRKHDQDGLDACPCLLVPLHLARGRDCLMVGDLDSGYIVVPHSDALFAELEARCRTTSRDPAKWLRRITSRAARQGSWVRTAACNVGPESADRSPLPRAETMPFDPPIPVLRIFDEDKAREFYLDFLGFVVDWTHRFEASLPLYMQVSRGRCVLHLSGHHGDACPGAALRIGTDALEELHAQLLAKQYRFARPGIVDQPWGQDMSVTDPFGNRLTFTSTQGD